MGLRKKKNFNKMSKRKKKRATKVKYIEVIRGKKEREKLVGDSCKECKAFYIACGLWSDTDPEANQRLLNRYSKHRHRRGNSPKREGTPPGFWDVYIFDSDGETTK